MPEIAQIRPFVGDAETRCWEAYDQEGLLAGYALAVDVPECGADAGEIQEMDKYQVFGITNPKEYKMVGLGERRVFLS